jgi:hypothetical protein
MTKTEEYVAIGLGVLLLLKLSSGSTVNTTAVQNAQIASTTAQNVAFGADATSVLNNLIGLDN